MLELVLSPAGHLFLQESTEALPIDAGLQADLTGAREEGAPEILLRLATWEGAGALLQQFPPVFEYWRTFAQQFLTAVCHQPEGGADLQVVPAPTEDLARLLESAPPMRGGEYLRLETLEALWGELDTYVRAEAKASPGGLAGWLRKRSPLWHRVGRVCFHLAENKRNPELPFAFLATYAPKLLGSGRVQYQPLSKALEEYAGAKNKQALINLLVPVQRAAEKSDWVKKLVDSGEVFHALAWKPDVAHRFLQDIPRLEVAGLLVRVPDWWSKRPSRVQVGVRIGEKGAGRFGLDAMLDFTVSMTLDGETLDPAEAQQLLESSQKLVYLKGKWVELDQERLKGALDHWKSVEALAGGDGVSFIEGMRLLAGAPLELAADDPKAGEGTAWSVVNAGSWLEEKLAALRQPVSQSASFADAGLHATLRPYQGTGVHWLRNLTGLGFGACLADDMGLGKTIQVLALLLLLKRQAPAATGPKTSLLVLPASLMGNWKSEIERFAPSLRAAFIHPSFQSSEDLPKIAADPTDWLKDTDLVLTTYGMITRQKWLADFAWRLVVADEAQAIKNPGARQTKAVKTLKAQARVALTGTPVENRLTDLWSLFDFLCPGLLGSVKEFGAFVKKLNVNAEGQYGPLRRLVSPYILRRMKTDKSIIADLPDKTEVPAYCNLSKKQAALYEQSVRELARSLEGQDGIARRGIVLAFILRFKQICNHPANWLGSGDYAPADSGKFRRLQDLCEEIAQRQEKVLVFTQFREMTQPLAVYLQTVFQREGLILDGSVAVGKRKKLVENFQREDGPPFFVLSLKAGGTGLNLTAASHVIHFDRWWNPAVENQATDRAFRIGQKKNVVVHKFICQGTIEEKIDAMIQDKTALAGELLQEGVPKLITEMGDKELLELVRLDLNTVGED
ncbi:MAG: DEAD/DEAH box helicase [Rhodanobacteraceae bacterium]